MAKPLRIFIIAGEASGDLHAKNLLHELKKKAPELECRGLGGDGLASEGMQLVAHIRESSFMGFVEIVKNLWKIKKLFALIKASIQTYQPDVVILVDYPAFNLKIAKWLKGEGIRSLYYISPTVWAWRKSRVEIIRKYVERMYVILPFEKEFYQKEGIAVDYAGHPLLDEIAATTFDDASFRKAENLSEKPILALLPGSRKQEIEKLLPPMLNAASRFPELQAVIAGAPAIPEDFYALIPGAGGVKIVYSKTYPLLHIAELAMVTSGTATLETALFAVPQVVCYAANPLSVWLARKLIQVKYISLVNLIMDREVVRELIQEDLTTENLLLEIGKLLKDEKAKNKLLTDYTLLREKLGGRGASERVAGLMLGRIKTSS